MEEWAEGKVTITVRDGLLKRSGKQPDLDLAMLGLTEIERLGKRL